MFVVLRSGKFTAYMNGAAFPCERAQAIAVTDTYEKAVEYMEGRRTTTDAFPGYWGVSVTQIQEVNA